MNNYIGMTCIKLSDEFLDQVVAVMRQSRQEISKSGLLTISSQKDIFGSNKERARQAARSYVVGNFPQMARDE